MVVDDMVRAVTARRLQLVDAARRGDDERAHGLAHLDRGEADSA